MKEIEVISAFVSGRPAETETLKSDGARLYTDEYIVAVWGNDGIEMSRTRDRANGRLLEDLVELQIEKDKLVKRLLEKNNTAPKTGGSKALCA